MPVETLQLARPLVNQLLHQAQLSPGFSQGLVLRDEHGHYQCRPLPTNADLSSPALRERWPAAFAFYRSSKTVLAPLIRQQLTTLSDITTLCLDIALDTKGVLQLRAWRLADGQTTQMDVSITEALEAAAPQ